MKVFNIKWDTDGDQELFDSLPKEVELPSKFSKENYVKDGVINAESIMLDDISDWLTDTYGFCHDGFSVDDETKGNVIMFKLTDDIKYCLEEACRQWCEFIDDAPERKTGEGFAEFFMEIVENYKGAD